MAEIKKYITLSRDITKHWLWEEKPFTSGLAWIDLLISANFSDQKIYIKGQLINVKRGQSVTAIKTFSSRWGWSQGKVKRFLKTLKNEDQIEYQNIGVTTLTTIIKYNDYQLNGDRNGDQTETRRRPDGDQTETSKKVKKGKKEKKEDKKEDKGKLSKLENELRNLPLPPGLDLEKWSSFITKRKTVNQPLNISSARSVLIRIKENLGNGIEIDCCLSKEIKKYVLECVLISEGEYDALVKDHEKELVETTMKNLNDYIQSNGKKYDSHFHTVRNWIRRDTK